MSEFIAEYYVWLSGLASWLTAPISNLEHSINIPLVSALLFGLLGATAPCQLSTNVAALAYLSRQMETPRRMWGQTAAFITGKVTVYLLIGGIVIGLGLQIGQLTETVVPVAIVARRALGPLLVIVGLLMLGLISSRLSVGGRSFGLQPAVAAQDRLSTWLEAKARGRQGLLPAYLMGAAFSFTFCPTLFWLFFGLTIPLAIASPGGMVFPVVFAVGTAMPVLVLATLLASGSVNVRQVVKRFKAADVWLQRVVGIVFILIGLNEIVLYWFI